MAKRQLGDTAGAQESITFNDRGYRHNEPEGNYRHLG